MRTHFFTAALCASLISSNSFAHGPQIQITVDAANSNKIVTRQLLPGNSYSTTNGLTAPASIYVMPTLPVTFLGQPVARVKPLDTQSFGPGFTYGYDQFASPGGIRPFTASLDLSVAGLKIWNGTAFVDTSAGFEQLGLLQSSGNVNPDSHKTVAVSNVHVPIPIAANYGADEHSSMRYQLLGDGMSQNVASRDGIYLVSLQLSGTQASPALTASDPFYFVLNKNAAFGDLSAAVNSFAASQGIAPNSVQYVANVPEPGSLLLAGCGLLLSVSSIRRFRHRQSGGESNRETA
jgi:hypothetical protein